MDRSQPRQSINDAHKKPVLSRAQQAMINAEKFKADVAQPKGKLVTELQNNEMNSDLSQLVCYMMENDDDEFFHFMCHIEPNLKAKIELGQFVELDKLLPRTRL